MSFAVDIPDTVDNPIQSINNSNFQLPLSSPPAPQSQNALPVASTPLTLPSASQAGYLQPSDLSSFDPLATSTYQPPSVGLTDTNALSSPYDMNSLPEPPPVPTTPSSARSTNLPTASLSVKPLSLAENAIYSVWLPSSSLSTVLSRLASNETPPDIHLWFTYPFVSATQLDVC